MKPSPMGTRFGLFAALFVLLVAGAACAQGTPTSTPEPSGALPPPVQVRPPEPAPLTPLPIETLPAVTVPATNPNDFGALLEQAVSLVRQSYPQAQLYEADGTIPGSGVSTAEAVQQWRFVFQNANNTTVMLSYALGNFQPPEFIPQPWLQDRVIRLPLKRGLREAIQTIKDNGYNEPFTSVVLRYALYPGVTEPQFVFTVPARNVYVFVGVESGTVTTQPLNP